MKEYEPGKRPIRVVINDIMKDSGMPQSKLNEMITILEGEDCWIEQTFFKLTQGDLDTIYEKANLSVAKRRYLQEHWDKQWKIFGADGLATTKFNFKVAYIFWQTDYSKLRKYLMEKCGMSEESAAKTLDLEQCKEDALRGIKMAKAFGISNSNIHEITDIKDARTIGKELFGQKGYKVFNPYSEGTGSLAFIYMAGHGAHNGKQHYLVNSENDVALDIENRLRVLADSCNVKVLAIYDICAVPLDSIKQ